MLRTFLRQRSDLRKGRTGSQGSDDPESPLAYARDVRAQQKVLDYPTLATLRRSRPAIRWPVMSTWLRDHLIRTGHMTETGISRRARIRRCRRCSSHILTGLDADVCAIEANADPVPLSPLGEALAVLEGRITWSLHSEGGRWVLDVRDPLHIAAHPAGTRGREDVVREHRCRSSSVVPALTASTRFPETRPPAPVGSEPGF